MSTRLESLQTTDRTVELPYVAFDTAAQLARVEAAHLDSALSLVSSHIRSLPPPSSTTTIHTQAEEEEEVKALIRHWFAQIQHLSHPNLSVAGLRHAEHALLGPCEPFDASLEGQKLRAAEHADRLTIQLALERASKPALYADLTRALADLQRPPAIDRAAQNALDIQTKQQTEDAAMAIRDSATAQSLERHLRSTHTIDALLTVRIAFLPTYPKTLKRNRKSQHS